MKTLETLKHINGLDEEKTAIISEQFTGRIAIQVTAYRKPAEDDHTITLEVEQQGSWIDLRINDYNPSSDRSREVSITLKNEEWEALKKHVLNAGMKI